MYLQVTLHVKFVGYNAVKLNRQKIFICFVSFSHIIMKLMLIAQCNKKNNNCICVKRESV